MSPLERIIHALEAKGCRGKGSSWQCPAHEDHRASLSVSEGHDGRVLLKCHAGCDTEAVVESLGLTLKDLFQELESTPTNSRGAIEAKYPYTDENGTLLYEVVRSVPKDFRQRRPDPANPGAYLWDLGDVRRVLYRLPDVVAAVKSGDRVYIVEGEKDADALASLGLCATTNSGGALKWRPEHSECLRGAEVVILPDNDSPGEKHAEAVALSLRGKSKSVRVLRLPGLAPKGDVSDWIAKGGTRESLLALVDTTAEFPVGLGEYGDRAARVRPVLVTLADVKPETVEWLWPGRIPLGKLSILEGDPGLGKSTAALDLAARVSRGRALPGGGTFGPCAVFLLSAEDGLADTIRPRLDAAEADMSRVFALRAVVVGDTESLPTIDGNLDAIERAVREKEARLVVIDPLMAYLGGDVNAHKDQDVRRALAPLSKMADDTGAAVLVVRHLTKGGGAASIYRGGGSIGIVGAARSALLVAKDPEDEARGIVASVKSNLSKPPASLAYRLEEAPNGAPRLAWEEGDAGITADELLAAQVPAVESGRPRDLAVAFLARYLAGGPRPADEVIRDGKAADFSEKTLRRAGKTLGVVSVKVGFPGSWRWALPEDGQKTPKMPTSGSGHLRPNVATFGAPPSDIRKMVSGDHLGEDDPDEAVL